MIQARTKMLNGPPVRREANFGRHPFIYGKMIGWYKRYCFTPRWKNGFIPYRPILRFMCSNKRIRRAYAQRFLIVIMPGTLPQDSGVYRRTGPNFCRWVSAPGNNVIADYMQSLRG